MVLALLSRRLSELSMVMSMPGRSLLFGRRVMGPPRLQLVLGCVPAGRAWERGINFTVMENRLRQAVCKGREETAVGFPGQVVSVTGGFYLPLLGSSNGP